MSWISILVVHELQRYPRLVVESCLETCGEIKVIDSVQEVSEIKVEDAQSMKSIGRLSNSSRKFVYDSWILSAQSLHLIE